MKIKKSELIVCLGFLILGIAILVIMPSQVRFAYFTANNTEGIRMATTTFPRLTALLIIFSSGIFLLQTLFKYMSAKKAGKPVEFEKGKEIHILLPVVMMSCIIAYAMLFRKLGFILDTVIMTLMIGLYLKSSKLQLLISCVIIPVAAYFIFRFMYVNLPSGILPF